MEYRSARPYYVDLGLKDVRTGMYDDFIYDSDGIPQYPYASGPAYNITFICHYALYQLSLYQKTTEPESFKRFIDVANWIVRNGRSSDNSFEFPYEFALPGLPAPWLSALGQGRILSVMVRAYEATGDDAFLRTAEKASQPFRVPVAEGGVRTTFPDGSVAYEEYPRAKTNVVLNGLITALFGLFDLKLAIQDREPGMLFDEGCAALDRNLFRYDLGYWSAYDLTGRVAGDEYHTYHSTLLWALSEISGRKGFAETAARWSGYRKGVRLFVGRNISRARHRLPFRKGQS